MHSAIKKTLFMIVLITVSISFLSGCIFKNIVGTDFSFKSLEISDKEGFPSLHVTYTCSGSCNIKALSSEGKTLDSEYVLYGENESWLKLGSYKECIKPGEYKVNVYDENNNLIKKKDINVDGLDLSVELDTQNWWETKPWEEKRYFAEFIFKIHNGGDTPAYPYKAYTYIDSEKISSYIIPSVVLPGETRNVSYTLFIEKKIDKNFFNISLKDSVGDNISNNSFSLMLDQEMEVEKFSWKEKGHELRISIPRPSFLFSYYNNTSRVLLDDYSSYVFDVYDEQFLEVLVNQIESICNSKKKVDRIQFVASLIQSLDYKEDPGLEDYPTYPIETIFSGGDCEDLSILAASVLYGMDYNVSLLRLTNHMAVGVKLDDGIEYNPYVDGYYFLETTSDSPVGFVPSQFKSKSGLEVYPISNRPLLTHKWSNGTLLRIGDNIKVTVIVSNLGVSKAENIQLEGVFYMDENLELNSKTIDVKSIKPNMKEKVTFWMSIPSYTSTKFKTRLIFNGEIVDVRKCKSSFP